jgi:hypothetical protein
VDVTVRVGVATRRPPREHAVVWVRVAVRLPDTPTVGSLVDAMWHGELESRETALWMAMGHPHVVMPVSARVVDVTNL